MNKNKTSKLKSCIKFKINTHALKGDRQLRSHVNGSKNTVLNEEVSQIVYSMYIVVQLFSEQDKRVMIGQKVFLELDCQELI